MAIFPFSIDPAPRTSGIPGSAEFSESLTSLGLPPPAHGTVELLVDGAEFFPALEDELRLARESIDLQLYIWDNDDISVAYADLVRKRARSVPTRILLDDIGSTISASLRPRTPAPEGFPRNPGHHALPPSRFTTPTAADPEPLGRYRSLQAPRL